MSPTKKDIKKDFISRCIRIANRMDRMETKPRNTSGQFTKTANPKSFRMYLTEGEKDLIVWLRINNINPLGIVYRKA